MSGAMQSYHQEEDVEGEPKRASLLHGQLSWEAKEGLWDPASAIPSGTKGKEKAPRLGVTMKREGEGRGGQGRADEKEGKGERKRKVPQRLPSLKKREVMEATNANKENEARAAARVHTGVDVALFYAQFGQQSSVKFFYCNPVSQEVEYRPYDLVVVPREQAGKSYVTMSASGLVNVENGVQGEFVGLGEWMWERCLFEALRKLTYFKHFRELKVFLYWRKTVRKRHFNRIVSQLEKRLFLAKPTFVNALLELHSHLYEVKCISFVDTSVQLPMHMERFSDRMCEWRNNQMQAVQNAIEQAQDVLERVCKEVTRLARLYQESIRDESELNDTVGVNLEQGRRPDKSRSMVSVKNEKIDRARTYHRVEQEAAMLGSFIRLADYMMVEAVPQLAVLTVEELKDQILSRNGGVFNTTVEFRDHGEPDDPTTVLDPAHGEMSDVLNRDIIEGMMSAIHSLPRFLFMSSFSAYLDGVTKNSGISPVSIVRDTERFQSIRTEINEIISRDYERAWEYVKGLDTFKPLHRFGKHWSRDEYVQSQPDLTEHRQMMKKQSEWKQSVERMKASHVEGTLHMDMRGLREHLSSIPRTTLDAIKQVLMGTARDFTQSVLNKFQSRARALEAKPTDLDAYVSFTQEVTEYEQQHRRMEEDYKTVTEMYDLLRRYETTLSIQDQVNFETSLPHEVERFRTNLKSAKAFLDERKQGALQELDRRIQRLNDDLVDYLGSLSGEPYTDDSQDAADIASRLERVMAEVQEREEEVNTLHSYQRLFNLPQFNTQNLSSLKKELQKRHKEWRGLADFEAYEQQWMQGDVRSLNVEDITNRVEEMSREAAGMAAKYWDDRVLARFSREIESFKERLPLVEQLADDALKERHWKRIFSLVGSDYDPDSSFSVQDLRQKGIEDKFEEVENICSHASKEYSLERALDKLGQDWSNVYIAVVPYKDTGTYVIGDVDEIQALLDDQMVKVQSMRASPFIKPFEERAQAWEDALQTLQDLLDNWLTVQATWQYLEPIFSSEDIVKQMPEEAEKFQQVDQIYRELLNKTADNPHAITLAREKSNLSNLKDANDKLDAVQRGLASYLEVKRVAFPRFFFLSNDEMLEILSETKDPTRVQPHLSKCFEGISSLTFEGEEAEITQMHSIEGEAVPFTESIKPAKARGAVEKWLVEVEQRMFDAMRDVHKRSIEAYEGAERSQWALEWPGQAVLTVSMIYWTRAMTDALRSEGEHPGSVQKVLDGCNNELSKIVDMVRGDLSSLNRITLGALVVIDVHARDVTANLVENGIDSEQSFDWTSQLRFYWEDDNIACHMMNASVDYGFEYLGNSTRLVITPLTDRCYRTLMAAIHLNYGGSPEGPAGTGKTETTKDLAKAIAMQCVVFNCSDSLDYLAMAKFFKGLAASGAWACFDEFNRIDLEVLSVVAQQVLEIQLAVKNKVETFFFEGSEIPLRPTCNVFITMNPGYAGRSELPDNLKALFRTVAMMVPDYAQIAEILLYSSGYLQARACAYKVVTTYKLCSEQLSSQDHYDYGMRAVMAVLKAAGNLKREQPQQDEFVLMLRAIIDVNLCKFLSHDVPLFNGIVSDLFPGVKLPEPDYGALPGALRKQCSKQNLQFSKYFRQKLIQLHDMIAVRHGLMIVGPPFSGKSAALHTLARSLTDLKESGDKAPLAERVQIRTINPKAVTMGQLYGETDKTTQEWNDGVLAVAFRHFAADQSHELKWIVLDGPVDALWIENMNTVLDDNKKLCLPNSEIIKMSSSMSMIFEVADLAVASPATVSRCGMVYMEAEELGWDPMFTSWLQGLSINDESKARLRTLFEAIAPPLLRLVHHDLEEMTPTLEVNCVQSAMRLFKALLDEFLHPGKDEDREEVPELIEQSEETHHHHHHHHHHKQGKEDHQAGASALGSEPLGPLLDSIFAFAAVWAFGSATQGEQRWRFERSVRTLLSGEVPQGLERFCPEELPQYEGWQLPDEENSLFEYTLDVNGKVWKPWQDTISPAERRIPDDLPVGSIIVPTSDWALCRFMLNLSIAHEFGLLFIGPTGTGKSVYSGQQLMKLPKEKYTPITLTLSARTSANMVQDQVDGALDKRRKGVYGPSPGKKAIVLVDDLNMPQKERYGAQPPIELLRQLMDMHGWYGRDNSFRLLQDVHVIAAMGPPGGGRTYVTQRYLRHFNIVGIEDLSNERMRFIFHTILDAHLERGSYPAAIKNMSHKLINGTLAMYDAAQKSLLPTPAKSHYTFNLRDFSRVIQGMALMPPAALPERGDAASRTFLRLWVHEVLRVFYDRLTDIPDSEWLLEKLREVCRSECEEDFDELMGHLKSIRSGESSAAAGGEQHTGESGEGEDGKITVDDMRRCIFGDYMDPDKLEDEGTRMYEEVRDINHLIQVMEQYLADYNRSHRPMNLAMFLFACEHLSRICRVLQQPGGHILLVGVGGSGRQSLTRLAAHVYHMPVHQVELSKQYGMTEWREDLKKVVIQAGREGKECVFLFSDSQIKDEAFVEDLNNILNRGEVPNMFSTEERMPLLESARSAAKKEGTELESPMEQWSYFVSRCKSNLHIALAFSPMGGNFRERIRQFPSIVNCCTIDWFQAWPSDALEAVAHKFLKDVEVRSEDMRPKLTEMCKNFHFSVRKLSHRFHQNEGRYNYVTPTSYLELISTFQSLLGRKRQENMRQKRRYDTGLEKIQSSSEQVAGMQEELEALKPELVKKSEEVEKRKGEIQKEKEEVVEPKKAQVKEEEQEAQAQADESKEIRDACDQQLQEAMPAYEEAMNALNTLNTSDINYIRTLTNPPAIIKTIMKAVCVLLDIKPERSRDENGRLTEDYWRPSLQLLADRNLINTLQNYDKDNIPGRIINKVRSEFINSPGFNVEAAANASAAAKGLLKWVVALDKYDKVAKEIAPKRENLKKAEAKYQEVQERLDQKRNELQEVLDKLEQMENDLQQATEQKQSLEEEVDTTEVKLDRAQKLINGLGDERKRWNEQSELLAEAYENLTGDVLIASGIVAYLGTFTMQYRREVIDEWIRICTDLGIPRSSHFSLNSVLGDPVKVREWHQAGLPNDSFSIDNGIILSNAGRWPLMIDPQNQANKWIQNMEKPHNLQTVKFSDGAEYIRTLENAIQFGLPVLLENVGEELDPTLEPVLLRNTFKSGGVMCIQLGDSPIEYSPDFRFYITTKLRNPHYLPETAVKVTLMNFTITEQGLADQLLGVLVAKERPELEEQKSELVMQGAKNKRRLNEIEGEILQVLSESEGNILDDERAINMITDAKSLGNEIAEEQKKAEQTEQEIDEARKQYAPCGSYIAILFFCISDLANIDPMYQYALSWFVNMFAASISESEKAENIEQRLENIKTHFTYSLFCNVCRSLFEKDKLLFAFSLAIRIKAAKGEVSNEEWMFLLTGGLSNVDDHPKPEGAQWLSDRAWKEVQKLDQLSSFGDLVDSIRSRPNAWRILHDSQQPHKERLPERFEHELHSIARLCIVRAIRPDRLVPAIQDFVAGEMGERYAYAPLFDIEACYGDSSPTTPLVFVLSPGSDPMTALLQFAESKGMDKLMNKISLGQGQGPKAAKMIQEASNDGTWVVLQNCHLAPSWMPQLEKICDSLTSENTHPEFRLWMTSNPTPSFPITILQNSVKMTMEPPKGLRSNLQRSYKLEPIANEEFFEGSSKPKAFKRLLFGLCFFHAIVQERRKFGPLGWNIPYGFDDSDLRISARQLRMFVDENEDVPISALRYLTGECNYGGRVTDDKDRILLNTLLETVYTPEIYEDDSYKLSDSGKYHAPPDGPKEEHERYIASLPITPEPEAFGLHENADITKDQNDAYMMCSSLLAMTMTGPSGGGTDENQAATTVREILESLPEDFNIEETQRRWPVKYEDSMNTVLTQEMTRYNRLLGWIRWSLQSIDLALRGKIVMGAEVDAAYRDIAVNRVPAMWKEVSYPTLMPLGSYVKDLLKRLEMLRSWDHEGQPAVFWISGFFFVQSFLTAALQNFARAHRVPIDEVAFQFNVLGTDPSQYVSPPTEGVLVHGMFIEGCGWDSIERKLCEAEPKVLTVQAPVFWLQPKHQSNVYHSQCYDCPLYRTKERKGTLSTTGHSTNFVMFVKTPTDMPPRHWIRRGVAMLCQLDN